MGRAEDVAQVVVVGAMLILVADDEADGMAGGLPLEQSGEELHTVAFLAGGGQTALTRATAVELTLDEIQVEFQSCGTAVDDTADGCAVALAERGQTKEVSESVQFATC